MAIIINDTAPRNQYTSTAGQTVFQISFEFFDVADVKVYNGTSLLTYAASPSNGTQYSVAGAGTNATGNSKAITLGSGGASNGDIITITRDIAVARTSDFPTSGQFEIDTLNTDLDKLTAMVSEREDAIKRSVHAPETDATGIDMELPVKATRATKVLGFDSDGDPVVTTKTLSALESEADNAATSATAAASSATAAASSASAASSSQSAASSSQSAAASSATAAATSATASATSATAAASSATSASNTAATLTGASSTTSLAIATGSKAFTVAAGLAFAVGDYVLATSNADTTDYMHGQIASYSGTTLTVTVASIGGSGTKNDWTIRRSGVKGATGATGSTGSTGAQGPQGDTGAAGSVSSMPDGSAGSPALAFSSDTNTGLFRPGADTYAIATGGTQALTIDSSQNVGIGVNSPARLLHLSSAAADTSVIRIENTSSHVAGIELLSTHGNWGVYNSDTVADALEFRDDSAAATRMIITSVGRIGIGTTAPDSLVEISSGAATTAKVSTSATNSYAEWIFEDGNAGYAWQTRSDAAQSIATGSFVINDRDSSTFPVVINEGCATNTLKLATTGVSFQGRSAFDANGNFSMAVHGATQATFAADKSNGSGFSMVSPDGDALQIYQLKTADVESHIGFKTGTDTNWYLGTSGGLGGIGTAGVYQTNSAAGWTNVSDERYKKSLQPITNALDKIKDCRGMTGLYKTDPDDRDRRSFLIAQDWLANDLGPVLPEVVDQNTTDDDGNEKLGMQYDATIPLLVECIKELRTQNIALAARVATLEGN